MVFSCTCRAFDDEEIEKFLDFYDNVLIIEDVDGFEKLIDPTTLYNVGREYRSACGIKCYLGISDVWKENYDDYFLSILVYLRSISAIEGVYIKVQNEQYDVYFQVIDVYRLHRNYGLRFRMDQFKKLRLNKILISPLDFEYRQKNITFLDEDQSVCVADALDSGDSGVNLLDSINECNDS
jgi:hypothetical protein